MAFLLLLVLFGMSVSNIDKSTSALAQVAPVYSPISLQTDKASYEPGDTIIVTGGITPGLLSKNDTQIVIQLYTPLGGLARVDIVNATADGRFTDSIPAGSTMNIQGEYRVLATYQGKYSGETSFQFEQTIRDYSCALTVCTYQLNIADKTYPINYRIRGVLENITSDIEKQSLKINVQTEFKNAVLLIALPKDVIQSSDNDNNATKIAFTVLVDGQNGRQSEQGDEAIATQTLRITNPESVRILAIDFARENKQIEIIGTWLVPEYSSSALAIIILAAISASLMGIRGLTLSNKKQK